MFHSHLMRQPPKPPGLGVLKRQKFPDVQSETLRFCWETSRVFLRQYFFRARIRVLTNCSGWRFFKKKHGWFWQTSSSDSSDFTLFLTAKILTENALPHSVKWWRLVSPFFVADDKKTPCFCWQKCGYRAGKEREFLDPKNVKNRNKISTQLNHRISNSPKPKPLRLFSKKNKTHPWGPRPCFLLC